MLNKLIIALIAILIYSNTMDHELVYDDNKYITDNPTVQLGFKGIKYAFTKDVYHWLKASDENRFYRPLLISSFCIEKELFDNNPSTGHKINIFLYLIALLILYEVMNLLFVGKKNNKLLALFVLILFAAHPLHTEVVANIKSRDEIMSLMFGSLSFLYMLRHINKKSIKYFFISLLTFTLALLSKESSITFIIIFPMLLFYKQEGSSIRNHLKTFLPYLIILAIFLIFRQSIMPETNDIKTTVVDNILVDASLSERIGTPLTVLLKYLKLIFIPYPLCYDYSFKQIPYYSFFSFTSIASLLVYLGILIGGLWLFIKRNLIGFGLLFYLITLSVTANIFFLIGSLMSERFLFVPLLGIVLVFVLIVFKYFKKLQAISILSFVVIVFSIMTINQNMVWKSNFTLFKHGIEVSPKSTRTQEAMGREYGILFMESKKPMEKEKYKLKAKFHIRKSLDLYAYNLGSINNLGNIFFLENKLDSALNLFETILGIDPFNITAIDNIRELGWKSLNKNDFQIAEKAVEILLIKDKRNLSNYELIAAVKVNQDNFPEAINAMKKIIKHEPENKRILQNLYNTYIQMGDSLEANNCKKRLQALN